MADITITIPDEHISRVRKALCEYAGLDETNANAKRAIVGWIKEVTLGYEGNIKIETLNEARKTSLETLEATYQSEQEALRSEVNSINIE